MAFGIPALDRLREMLLGAMITRPYNGQDVGIALPGGNNAPILAFGSGRVISAEYTSTGGRIVVSAPNGYQYIYRQVGSLLNQEERQGGPVYGGSVTRPGDLVTAGQVIGFQGPNGFALGLAGPQGSVDPAAGLGANVKAVWYRLYHVLGLGGGAIGGGQITSPPSATELTYSPVPWPLPPDPSQAGGAGGGAGPIAVGAGYTGEPGAGGGVLGLPQLGIGDLADPGKLALGCLSTAGAPLALGVLGIILVIAGLQALTKEPPIQVVTAPVEGAVKGAVKTAGAAAKVAAVA